jgi:hypothetical protein
MMNSAVCLEVVSADISLTTFMKWYHEDKQGCFY